MSAAQQRLLQVTAERRRAQAAANHRYRSNLTPERAADMRARRAQARRQSVSNDTPDKAAARRQRHAETQRRSVSHDTPEEAVARRQQHAEVQQRHIANQSPTEAAARVEAHRRAVQAGADRQRAAAEALSFDASFERDPEVALRKFIVNSGTLRFPDRKAAVAWLQQNPGWVPMRDDDGKIVARADEPSALSGRLKQRRSTTNDVCGCSAPTWSKWMIAPASRSFTTALSLSCLIKSTYRSVVPVVSGLWCQPL